MKVRITDGMLSSMIMCLVYAKAVGLTQGVMAREVYGDIWLATMISGVKGLLFIMLTVYLIRKAPDRNMLEQFDLLLGKWAGKLVGIVIFVFFTGAFGTIMITFVYHLMDYFLPQAPTYIFFAVGLSVCLYGLYKGLEVLARTAFLGILAMVIFNILLVFGSLQQFDIKELLPLFQSGVWETVRASRHNDTDWGMSTMMAALLLPLVKSPKEWNKAAAAGIVCGSIIVVQWPILESAVLSPEMAAQYIVSCMQLARSAEIGVFMHRYEMIMVAMFIIPLYVQMMLCLYCGTVAVSHTFGGISHGKLFVPVVLAMGGAGYYIVNSHFRAVRFLQTAWPYLALPIIYGLPLLLLALSFIRRKKLQSLRPASPGEGESSP